MELQVHRADEITRLHEETIGLMKKSLVNGIRIGQLLTEQKESLAHGQFGPWIESSLPFTARTAQNYMRLYLERDKLKYETVSQLNQAYKLLSDKIVRETRWEDKEPFNNDLLERVCPFECFCHC